MHHQGRSFQPWEGLDAESQKFSENLQAILQVSFLPPSRPPPLPSSLLSSPWPFLPLSEPPLACLLPPGHLLRPSRPLGETPLVPHLPVSPPFPISGAAGPLLSPLPTCLTPPPPMPLHLLFQEQGA